MLKTRSFAFLFAKNGRELSSEGQRRLFYVWNVCALLLSSGAIAVVSLALALGQTNVLTFYGYFRHPLIFFLNYLPILIFQALMLCFFARQYLAFLGSGLVFISASIGNYYKLRFRSEPFVFSDLGSIKAGLDIAADYDMSPNVRVVAAAALLVLGTVILFFFAKGQPRLRGRIVCAGLLLLLVWPLWRLVYSSDDIYYNKAVNVTRDDGDVQEFTPIRHISKGFVYPFIFSIKQSAALPPQGYSEETAMSLLDAFPTQDIPDDRKVNILVFQLEAFSDLSELSTGYDFEPAYTYLHQLQQESISGHAVANVFGGGTIKTEQNVLTGKYKYADINGKEYSYIWYLAEQGYYTTGSHPNRRDFYNRINVNYDLGFSEYLYEDHYSTLLAPLENKVQCDSVFMPEVIRLFLDKASQGENVFSFNVSFQGHSPYDTEKYTSDYIFWDGGNCSEATKYAVNNYLGSVYETQEILEEVVDHLRKSELPVVLLLYGDHKPALSLSELGVNMDTDTEEGFMNYYSSNYLIWANNAAKLRLGNDFTGTGPTVSMNYLMNVLFDSMGWQGPPFMQFSSQCMDRLPVISANGYYCENGVFSSALSPDGQELLSDIDIVSYFERGKEW